MSTTKPAAASFSADLLAWYDAGHRDLPWRAAPGSRADPYHVMLSEIMLQQTVVATVIPYFHAFLARWPDVQALAAAGREDIMRAWAGLGYYARARRLHEAAQKIAFDRGGVFPDDEAGWRALPGIGPYTAAAMAAIGFARRAVVVDGNVERVVARLFAVAEPLPAVKPHLRDLAAGLTPAARPGDYAQAMMDLGATICTPRRPRCQLCPVAHHCAAAGAKAADYPRRAPRAARPERRGEAYVLTRPDGAVLLEARPQRGLLGGMTGFPLAGFDDTRPVLPQGVTWQAVPGEVRHVFTHFRLTLQVMRGSVAAPAAMAPHQTWALPQALGEAALPSLMRKILAHAINQTGART
ncbi:MAG: A/G-specific adenine glycosylase [Hyphomicrobiales bacterium]|nr:A/G-specific adenine glycosylase [Hyphomicrobiales bacterium]